MTGRVHDATGSRSGPASPRSVGPYELLRELGRGGSGTVHLARHVQLGREVALKRLTSREPSPRALERFQREAEVLARLRHPNLVRLHETGQDGRCPWLALELVEGGSLQARLQREGPLPEREAAALLRTLALAVEHLHQHGVLHRDLKPANVLLDPVVGPKLGDLGTARLREGGRERLTRTGELIGTISFMSPEQIDADPDAIDARADVYGLGATLFALLTGGPPFAGGGGLQVIARVLREPPAPPSTLRPGISPAMDALVLRCLAKEPAARPPSAAALAGELEALLAPAAPVAPAARRGAGPLVGAGLLGLAVALAAWRASLPAPAAEPGASPAAATTRADPAPAATVAPTGSPIPTWFRELTSPPPLPVGLWPSETTGAYRWRDGSLLMWIPPGEFTLGAASTGAAEMDQLFRGLLPADPRRVVIEPGLFLGRHELTWGQYLAFCRETGRPPPGERSLRYQVANASRDGFSHNTDAVPDAALPPHPENDRDPVWNVSWHDATAYCHHYGLRLPSEAEWEWAARGPGPGGRYPWGDRPPDPTLRNGADPGDARFPRVAPVGSLPAGASPWGCLDMAGNLSEWVEDRAAPYPDPGPDGVLLNPCAPPRDANEERVLRGGHWAQAHEQGFTVHYRVPGGPHIRTVTYGFRVALDPSGATRARRP